MEVVVYNNSGLPIPMTFSSSMDVNQVRDTLFEHGLEVGDVQLVKLNGQGAPIDLRPNPGADFSWESLSQTALRTGDEFVLTIAPTVTLTPSTDTSEARARITVEQVKTHTEPLHINTDNSFRSGSTKKSGPVLFNGQELDLHGKLVAVVTALLNQACEIQTAMGIYEEEGDDSEMPASAEESYDPRSEVDEGSLMTLSSMGFAENHCIRALITTGGNVEQAMEYLLMHTGDPVLDAPLTPPPKAIKSKRGGAFHPDPAAFRQLRDMGFEEEAVLAALQVARNQSSEATELLLSGQDVQALRDAQVDPEVDTSNPIIKAVLADPVVNDSLQMPRMREALEMILQDFNKATALLNDGQVGPPLLVVVKLVQSYVSDGEGEPQEPGNSDVDDDNPEPATPSIAGLTRLYETMRHLVSASMDDADDDEDEDEDDDDDDDDMMPELAGEDSDEAPVGLW
eukprot:m.193208 g.193208  ORF g.193208 m.193208 type:complete len:455 (+) comp16978_c0_seq1:128-1492(+)